MNNKQILIMLRGVSGSGKSTLANLLAMLTGGVAIATDDFFMKDGKYEWNDRSLGAAHKDCFARTENALQAGTSFIVVHNTSTSNHDVFIYQELAEKYEALYFSLVVENRHGSKNVHNVADEKVMEQALRLMNNIKLTEGTNFTVNLPKKKKEGDSEKLEVVAYLKTFMKDTDTWFDEALESLNEEYAIRGNRYNGKVILKYEQSADKSPQIVRECRGLILCEKTLEVISIPFEKFGNYMESYAANDIDFAQARVMEKLDGSCTGLYFDQIQKKWLVQTLGQVEAEQIVQGWGLVSKRNMTWAELFWEVFDLYGDRESILASLDKNFTYMFELCTPWTRVVVQHAEPKLYFLGMRNKKTLKEALPESCPLAARFDRPKEYAFNDVKSIRKICKELPKDNEGFVVVDKDFRRVKLKGEAYMIEHYASTVITVRSVASVVFKHEWEEWLSVFPEFTEVIMTMLKELDRLGAEVDEYYAKVLEAAGPNPNQKAVALATKGIKNTGLGRKYVFMLFNGTVKNGKEAIMRYLRPEELTMKVNEFLEHSNVDRLITFNTDNGSLR